MVVAWWQVSSDASTNLIRDVDPFVQQRHQRVVEQQQDERVDKVGPTDIRVQTQRVAFWTVGPDHSYQTKQPSTDRGEKLLQIQIQEEKNIFVWKNKMQKQKHNVKLTLCFCFCCKSVSLVHEWLCECMNDRPFGYHTGARKGLY